MRYPADPGNSLSDNISGCYGGPKGMIAFYAIMQTSLQLKNDALQHISTSKVEINACFGRTEVVMKLIKKLLEAYLEAAAKAGPIVFNGVY